jgi:DNA-binding CsgD family transcriptional regulator/PAS domain-containing protein
MNRVHETPSSAPARPRPPRCPYTEQECADRAASILGVVALTGVAAVGFCVGRHRIVWSSGRTEGPVGAWMATALRTGSSRADLFPGFKRALAAATREDADHDPFLTVLPGERSPLPAEARVRLVDRGPRREPHLALVSLRDYVDGDAGMPPFEVAILRSLVVGMGLEAAVTNADLRITWASPALEDRAGVGTLTGRALHEVTSVQERDALVDLARQVAHRRQDRPALARTLTTGRSASVADLTQDVAIAGLLWWWTPGTAGADCHRMASIEEAVTHFVDDLAWAGVETTRLSAKAVGSFSTGELLTPREREILELLSTGLRAPSIATRLYLSQSTVRNHLSTAFKKMGVTSQAEFFELVAAADAGGPAPRPVRRRGGSPVAPNDGE